jgi:excisionase family DNA binding protein
VVKTDKELFFGLSGAASFLACDQRTVKKAADSLRLPCTRDAGGKRLFRLADLQTYKRNNRIGNIGRPPFDARGRRAVAHG